MVEKEYIRKGKQMDFIMIEKIVFGHRAKNFLLKKSSLINAIGSEILKKAGAGEIAKTTYNVLKTLKRIPEDSQLHAFGYSFWENCFYIGVSSNSFEEVMAGSELPREVLEIDTTKDGVIGMELGCNLTEGNKLKEEKINKSIN